MLTFLFLLLPLSLGACDAGELLETVSTHEPSPLVSVSGAGDGGAAASSAPSPELPATEAPATPAPTAETAETEEPAPTESAVPETEEENIVILRIGGEGVNDESGYSLADLQALSEGYAEETYSELSGWPSASLTAAKGIRLDWLLEQCGIRDDAGVIQVTNENGNSVSFTRDQLLGTQYRFPEIQEGSAEGAVPVPPMLAWACLENSDDLTKTEPLEGLRLILGQTGIHNTNEPVSLVSVASILVTTDPPSRWDRPCFSVAGDMVIILHDDIDDVKIYYTTDGSDPTEDSFIYNPSVGNLQPDLNAPFSVEPGATVSAFAVGYGRDNSEISRFTYTA